MVIDCEDSPRQGPNPGLHSQLPPQPAVSVPPPIALGRGRPLLSEAGPVRRARSADHPSVGPFGPTALTTLSNLRRLCETSAALSHEKVERVEEWVQRMASHQAVTDQALGRTQAELKQQQDALLAAVKQALLDQGSQVDISRAEIFQLK